MPCILTWYSQFSMLLVISSIGRFDLFIIFLMKSVHNADDFGCEVWFLKYIFIFIEYFFLSLFSLLYSFYVKISLVRLVCTYEDAHAHIYSGCNELRINEMIFKVKIKVSKYVYTNRWCKTWLCVYDVIKHSVITAILARSSLKMFLIG